MESTKGVPYKSKVVLAKELGISPGTVNNRAKEIKEEVLSGRYPDCSVIEDGGLKLINYLVFIDYLNNRQKLREPNLRKYVQPFDAYEIAKSIGYYQ
jgi:DNA-binding Lrp family transcriptional regulator